MHPKPAESPPTCTPVQKSRDIFDAVRSFKEETKVENPTLGQRLLRKLQIRKDEEPEAPRERARPHSARVANHMTHDWEPENNPTHRKLPEEHSDSWRATRYLNSATVMIPDYSSDPINRRDALGDNSLDSFKKDLDRVFLSPLEQEVFHYLSQVGRVAHYKGLLRAHKGVPLKEAILVHQNDIEPLQKIQIVARKMSDVEKENMLRNLATLLPPKPIYTLKLLLADPDLRITASSVNTGVESPEFTHTPPTRILHKPARPTSMALLTAGRTGVLDHWARRDSSGYAARPERDPVRLATEMHSAGPARFFSSRPFTVEEVSEEEEEEEEERDQWSPGLRGGAEESEDSRFQLRLPLGRSGRAYLDYARSGDGPAPLGEDERVPKALWWLAGGRVRYGKKVPTAGELRSRKKAEAENRKAVGFVGTLAGVRVPREER